MTTPAPVKCWERHCKWFIGWRPAKVKVGKFNGAVPYCYAFKEVIPKDIAYGDNLHLEFIPGDKGIKYEQGEFEYDKELEKWEKMR